MQIWSEMKSEHFFQNKQPKVWFIYWKKLAKTYEASPKITAKPV